MTVSISIDLVGFSPAFHSLIFEKITQPDKQNMLAENLLTAAFPEAKHR